MIFMFPVGLGSTDVLRLHGDRRGEPGPDDRPVRARGRGGARGLTDIVVIGVGLNTGMINGHGFTVPVMVALITTAMAGPALRWLGLWQPAGCPATAPPDSGVPAAHAQTGG